MTMSSLYIHSFVTILPHRFNISRSEVSVWDWWPRTKLHDDAVLEQPPAATIAEREIRLHGVRIFAGLSGEQPAG